MTVAGCSIKPFSALTAQEFFAIVQLRVDVFVVEQACCYREFDELDQHPGTLHFQLFEAGALVAYARLLGCTTAAGGGSVLKIGRVVTRKDARKRGLGRLLMRRILQFCDHRFPHADVELAAQVAVIGFYSTFGFVVTSEQYIDDGIPHIDMRRSGTGAGFFTLDGDLDR